MDAADSPAPPDSETTNGTPDVFIKLQRARPTKVFDSYWYLAAERQDIFFRKIRTPYQSPFTDDEILQTYKFTNAYRASDRVSQYLIQDIIYDPVTDEERGASIRDTFFRILLFKIFNRISTWELLQERLGEIRYETFDVDRYTEILEAEMQSGHAIYSGAYLMASGNRAYGQSRKHANHLRMLEEMMDDGLPEQVHTASSMAAVFHLLLDYPTIGTFLAYQYATDINYSRITDFPEDEFVYPGPGAESGLRKCFEDPGDFSDSDLIRFMMDVQEEAFDRQGLDFQDLWGRRLQLIDCQNLFCEVDKYARKRHPDMKGSKGRSNIKQKYKPSLNPIAYYYPPDWGINEKTPFSFDDE